MEYQQFINWLKKNNLYDKFFDTISKCPSLGLIAWRDKNYGDMETFYKTYGRYTILNAIIANSNVFLKRDDELFWFRIGQKWIKFYNEYNEELWKR